MPDLNDPRLVVGVVGAGAMGAGIAQVTAAAGLTVLLYDQREGAARDAQASILARLDKRVAAGKMDAGARDAVAARLKPLAALDDLAPCGLVVEAIIEDLEIKRGLFRALCEIVANEAVLCSNTSSLPIGAICAGMPGADRIAGLHFFNPVPVMKLVEVIPGPDTRPDVVLALRGFAALVGRQPVEARDTPGFLVNYGGRAFTTEALAILQENVASVAQIDAVMRDCWGFRMGPFELMDLTGMDVNFPVTEFIHGASFSDPRLRTTFLHRYMLLTGQLGRKSGRGFYDYREGGGRASPDAPPDAAPARALVLPEGGAALRDLIAAQPVEVLERDDGRAPILAALWGEDCAAYCARTGTDHRRFVGLDLAGDVSRRVTLMTAPGAEQTVLDSVAALLAQSRAVTTIKDSPGFIGQRIAAMVGNLGCEMAQIGLAVPQDIDVAMRLGLNYPKGPLELVDSIGPEVVLRILTTIQGLTGDDRYRPSQWLRRRAALGLSALQPA